MKKRFFAIMLTICMVVSLAPMVARAEEPTTVSDADSLKTAIETGGTVALGNDITIESNAEHYSTIADGISVVLDLKGYTITVTDKRSSGNFDLFYILGEMTVKNGTIVLNATTNRDWNAMSTIFHNRGGVLTIESGTYTHNGGTDMAYVVDNSGNYYGDAYTYVTGGTLSSSYTAIRNFMSSKDATNGASGTTYLYISGGSVSGSTSAIWAQAPSTNANHTNQNGVIEISGGIVGLINTARTSLGEVKTTISGGTVEAYKGEVGELSVTGSGKITGEVTILTAAGEATDYEYVEGIICNHADGTELKNVKEATYTEVGYTGDKVCKDCGKVMEEGTEIPKITCNHANGTELENVKEATYTEAGYTGDEVCKDCGQTVKEGTTIEKLEEPKEPVQDEDHTDEDSDEEVDKDSGEELDEDSDEESSDIPKTGDTANIGLYVVCLVMAAVVAVVSRKRAR